MKITHIKNNLFRLRDKAVLAHAIAQDGRMGAGIAKTFSQNTQLSKKMSLLKNHVLEALVKQSMTMP